jgi:hypothetical protein
MAIGQSLAKDAKKLAKRCLGVGTDEALAEAIQALQSTVDYCSALRAHAARQRRADDAKACADLMEDCFWSMTRLKDVAAKRALRDARHLA